MSPEVQPVRRAIVAGKANDGETSGFADPTEAERCVWVSGTQGLFCCTQLWVQSCSFIESMKPYFIVFNFAGTDEYILLIKHRRDALKFPLDFCLQLQGSPFLLVSALPYIFCAFISTYAVQHGSGWLLYGSILLTPQLATFCIMPPAYPAYPDPILF